MPQILAFHATNDCSNGPPEATNLLVKRSSGSVSSYWSGA
jgi:hypothetical protein